jgi:hypothetical protein
MTPRRRILMALAVVLATAPGLAQVGAYPQLVAPQQVFTAPADGDTVFVLSRAQYARAILAVESLDLADSTITLLERKAGLLGRVIVEQQGIIDVRTEAYVRYRDLWTETDQQLEEAEIKVDKLKRDRWRWSLVSAVVVGVAAFFIGTAVD